MGGSTLYGPGMGLNLKHTFGGGVKQKVHLFHGYSSTITRMGQARGCCGGGRNAVALPWRRAAAQVSEERLLKSAVLLSR